MDQSCDDFLDCFYNFVYRCFLFSSWRLVSFGFGFVTAPILLFWSALCLALEVFHCEVGCEGWNRFVPLNKRFYLSG